MMTASDREAIERAAKVDGMEASTWVRVKVLEIAKGKRYRA